MASKPHKQAPSRKWEWVSPSAARVVEQAPQQRSGQAWRSVARGLRPRLGRLSRAIGHWVMDRIDRLSSDEGHRSPEGANTGTESDPGD